ncbi:MAG: hypothetical protein LBB77_06660 [Treponema sp.]|jgi:hypothetical protein|nr:hypothetical protein [Treponema sp.]
MKKYIAALAVLLGMSSVVFAELPQDGRWYFEVLGTGDILNIEIKQNDWYFLMGDDAQVKQTVTVDSGKKTVIIPLFTQLSDFFYYDVKEDFTDFFIGEKANIDLFYALKGSMNELEGINSVSDEFVENFIKQVEEFFLRTPILRLRKFVE